VLRFEDSLWGEDYYFTAAEGTIQIYLNLHDHPPASDEDTDLDYSTMTAAERKKAKNIARKKAALAKKKDEAQKKKTEENTTENGSGQRPKKGDKLSPVEDDPDGKNLLRKDPLAEAKIYSSILSNHCPNRLGTWVLQYDVAIRRKKPMMALQALFKMQKLDARSPNYVTRLTDFWLKSPSFQLIGAASTVLTKESASLLHGQSVTEYVTGLTEDAKADPKTPLLLRVAIAELLVSTKAEPPVSAAKLIVEGGMESRGVTLESCRTAYSKLKFFGAEVAGLADQWASIVKEHFPLAKDFH
jgi:hypothetical protein